MENFLDLKNALSKTTQSEMEMKLPTGSVKVERSPPEREVVSSSHSRVIPKTC